MPQLSATMGLLAALAQTLSVPAARPRPVPAPDAALFRPAPFESLLTPARRQRPKPRVLTFDGAPAGLATPTVVCGTVVVPVDPTVDRRMVRPAPSDAAYTMRAIKPPVCRD